MPLWPMLMGDAGGGGGPTGPITLDGAAASDTLSNSDTFMVPALVTSLTNDLLIAAINSGRGTAVAATVASVTSTSGLVWSRVGAIASALKTGSKHVNLEVWAAFAPAALAGEVVTFHLTAACVCNCFGAAAFHGVVGPSGVYTLDGSVLTNAAPNSGHPSVTMTTTFANDLIIYASGGDAANKETPTGFTQDVREQNFFGLLGSELGMSHKIPLATLSGVVLEPASASGVGVCLAFALKGS